MHEERRDMKAHNSTTRATSVRWLSNGTTTFEYDGIVVRPAAVQFDARNDQFTVTVAALSSDPSAPTPTDFLLARISAFVVAGSLRRFLPRISVALRLRFPGNLEVAVEPALSKTAVRIANRREYLRRRGHTDSAKIVLGQVLAYVLSSDRTCGRNARKPEQE